MIAILLCAGFGTRLHPTTKNTPKGLLEVAGRHILDFQLPQLLDLPDVKEMHLVTNGRYVAQFYNWIESWRGKLDKRGVAMHLHSNGALMEDERRGSVGDLAFLLRTTKIDQPVVITAGDNIYRFPLRPIAQQFLKGDDNLILALREESYQVRQRYAVVEFGEGDRVAHLHDEPEEPPTEWVCPSLYFLQPQALNRVHEYLEQGGHYDSFAGFLDYVMEHEPVRALRKPNAEAWLDVETRYMLKKANDVLESEPVMLEQEAGR